MFFWPWTSIDATILNAFHSKRFADIQNLAVRAAAHRLPYLEYRPYERPRLLRPHTLPQPASIPSELLPTHMRATRHLKPAPDAALETRWTLRPV